MPEGTQLMRKYFSPKLTELIQQLPYLPRALSLVWSASRRWTLSWEALVDWMLTDQRSAAEMRIFDLGTTFKKTFRNCEANCA